MDISRSLGQTVSWQAVTSTNDRDDPTYGPAVSLPARKVQRLKDLISKDGEVTTATNQITMPPNVNVAIGDLLDGREVIAVSTMVDYRGVTVGVQALTR